MGRQSENIARNIRFIDYRTASRYPRLVFFRHGNRPDTRDLPVRPFRLACRSCVTHFAPSLLSSGGAIFFPCSPSRLTVSVGGEGELDGLCSTVCLACQLGASGEGEKLID